MSFTNLLNVFLGIMSLITLSYENFLGKNLPQGIGKILMKLVTKQVSLSNLAGNFSLLIQYRLV